jgi:hypothetical protein
MYLLLGLLSANLNDSKLQEVVLAQLKTILASVSNYSKKSHKNTETVNTAFGSV